MFPPSLWLPIIGTVVLLTVLKPLINMIFSKHLLNRSLLSGSSIDDSRERQRVGERERGKMRKKGTPSKRDFMSNRIWAMLSLTLNIIFLSDRPRFILSSLWSA